MEDLLAPIVDDALVQADELRHLDAVRAELWASDLAALAAETGDDGITRLVAAIREAGSPASAAALWALDAVIDGVDLDAPSFQPSPEWADTLATSRSEGAWLLSERRGLSAAFRFVDASDTRHIVVIDLVPGEVETLGEVTVGPHDLLDVLSEEDAGIDRSTVNPSGLAARVADAFRATIEPTASLVAAGRLLMLRLSTFGITGLVPPVWSDGEVPALPERDPEDDAYALEVLHRALGSMAVGSTSEYATAAAVLRDAAAIDGEAAQWLAASVGPVDLLDDDESVALSALAAVVAPQRLEPLSPQARNAVLELEWADWLGVVIGLVRAGPGTPADPDHLVDLINRCPEVTSTIPKKDRPRVAWALAVCTELWSATGVVSNGALTDFGVAALPSALDLAWRAR